MSLKISCFGCSQKLDLSEMKPFSRIKCPVCSVEIIVPKPFGNILLEEDLGSGTLAHVYRSMDVTLDREVALKVVNDDIDKEMSDKFISEARKASNLNHPNVIPIYSCGEMDEHDFITMQYMDGGTLKRKLSKGVPDKKDALRWMLETAKGLETAYIADVFHYNITPATIFLDSDGNIKIGDFGLSRIAHISEPLLDGDDLHELITLELSHYISPEKLSSGEQEITGDIYSLGASFYHLLTGFPAFGADTALENCKERYTGPPKPPKKISKQISIEISDLIMRMLNVYPSERPQSYTEVIEILERAPLLTKGQSKTIVSNQKPISIKRKEKKVLVVSQDIINREVEMKSVGFLWYVIPILVISVLLLLGVAHVLNLSWYENHILPVFQNFFAQLPTLSTFVTTLL